jgi:hypothetical protein
MRTSELHITVFRGFPIRAVRYDAFGSLQFGRNVGLGDVALDGLRDKRQRNHLNAPYQTSPAASNHPTMRLLDMVDLRQRV